MKKIILSSLFVFICLFSSGQGITTARYADLTAINAIPSPQQGMMVYNNATQTYWFRNATAWENLAATLSPTQWTTSGNDIYNNNAGKVGISYLNSSPLTGTSKLVVADDAGFLRAMSPNVGKATFSSVGIADNTCNGPLIPITISGAPTNFQSNQIALGLNINHTFDAELRVYLLAPTGQLLNLIYQNGGTGDNFIGTTFSDGYANSINTGTAPFTGGFKPMGSTLSICSGTGYDIPGSYTFVNKFGDLGTNGFINPNGTWYLILKDLGLGDTGTFLNCNLNFYDGRNTLPILQFPNDIKNKKIALYDAFLDEHRFYGFGINNSTLRYQVDATFANHTFYAATSPTTSNELFRIQGNGNATLAGTLTQNSDFRLKKDISKIRSPLEKINQLNGYHYHWKDSTNDQSLQLGLIAQELQKVYPELVKTNEKGFLSVNYNGLIPVLIEAIKEQQVQIESLKSADIKGVMERISKLEAMNVEKVKSEFSEKK